MALTSTPSDSATIAGNSRAMSVVSHGRPTGWWAKPASRTGGSIGAANKVVLNDEQERNVYQLALGPAFDEMLADDVPWPIVKHAGMTAWVAWVRDRESAERHWARLKQDGQGNPGGEPPETAD